MISFIVPAYNEEQCLAETIDALHATGLALGEAYEVVVADDGSTDQTAAIVVQKGAVLISATHRQIAATRNSGARAATGDLLILLMPIRWSMLTSFKLPLRPCAAVQ